MRAPLLCLPVMVVVALVLAACRGDEEAASPTGTPTVAGAVVGWATPSPDHGFDTSTPAPTLCTTVTFRGVTKCLPEGARFGAVAPLGGLAFSYVERGQSFFRYSEGELIDWHVAAEDEADFAELKVLFLGK